MLLCLSRAASISEYLDLCVASANIPHVRLEFPVRFRAVQPVDVVEPYNAQKFYVRVGLGQHGLDLQRVVKRIEKGGNSHSTSLIDVVVFGHLSVFVSNGPTGTS